MDGLKSITTNTPPEAEPDIYAEDDAAIYQAILGEDGVFTIGQKCAATVLSNNKVRISDGVIMVGGHFARIKYGQYVDVDIANGQSGYKRNDIICGKFVTTGEGGIDDMSVEVKQGVAAATATDPALTQDNLYNAGKIREMPLYRVKIEGLSIVAVEPLFEYRKTTKELEGTLSDLNSNLKDIVIVEPISLGNQTIPANAYIAYGINATKEGYEALGIVGYITANTALHVSRVSLSDIVIVNGNTYAVNCNPIVHILFAKE